MAVHLRCRVCRRSKFYGYGSWRGFELWSNRYTFNLNHLPKGLNVVGTVSSPGEIGQVKLNLIPSLIQSHGHGANEGLHTGSRLVVGGSESTTHVLVVKHLHLEGEIFL